MLLPWNDLIIRYILTDYVKLRKNNGEGKCLMIMKSLEKNPKKRISSLFGDISRFRKKWDYMVSNLEDYYRLYDNLDTKDRIIITHISLFLCYDNEKVAELNEKYGQKFGV